MWYAAAALETSLGGRLLTLARAGHVFCYPCVLHYLALAEHGQKFRKCPVCHECVAVQRSLPALDR